MSDNQKLNANEELIRKKAKKDARNRRVQRVKEFFILLFVIAVFGGGITYAVQDFASKRYDYVRYTTVLNDTTQQISRLIDNVRNFYAINPDKPLDDLPNLVNMGVIPSSVIRGVGENAYIENPFGGKVIIAQARPLWDKNKKVSSPTFKMSYQGLPRRACIDLATLNWGDNRKGLIAMAVGEVDLKTGVDSAFTDIDADPRKKKQEDELTPDGLPHMGFHRFFTMNVAKPGDPSMPAPFSKGSAEMACMCRDGRCAFAVQYTVFAVE